MERPRAASGSTAVLGLALVVGVGVRVGPVLSHPWPLHDGGLFFRMISEIVADGLRIPSVTSYGGVAIPFAYPPLALWLAAVLKAVTSLPLADVMRLLPVTFSILELPAFFLLARDLLPDRRQAAVATLAFAVEPYAYSVHITGGGLTRSLGMLFAILAVWQGLRLLRTGARPITIVSTGGLAGLGALSHPESGVFVTLALGLAWVFQSRSRPVFARLLAAGLVAALVSTPWWLVVVLQHGTGPLSAALAGTDRDLVASVVTFLFVYLLQGPLPVFGLLALLGEVQVAVTRRPFLIVWLASICLVDLRYSPVAGAVPASLLVAIGSFEVAVPTVTSLAHRMHRTDPARWSGALVGLVVVSLAGVGVLQNLSWYGPSVALTSADRTAMAWVASKQPPGRAFVVLGGPTWGSDDVAEWFPALADHRSLTTSQGLEWVAGGAHSREVQAEAALRTCQPEVADGCLADWLATYAVGAGDWGVYIAADGSAAAQGSPDVDAAARAWLRTDRQLRIVYDGPGALIAVPVALTAEATGT